MGLFVRVIERRDQDSKRLGFPTRATWKEREMFMAWEGQVQVAYLWVEGGVGRETGIPGSWVPESGVQGPERPEQVSNINSSCSMKLPEFCKS